MINKLFIKNYAIINNLEVDFFKGLTTVTGETGAGKSIILGALNLLLGNRFDSINFKDKTKKTIVEGNFDISNLNINFFQKATLIPMSHLFFETQVTTGSRPCFAMDTLTALLD